MWYEWDEQKNQTNIQKHGVAFERVFFFDWPTAMKVADLRLDYGETRWTALGTIDNRLHALIFTLRSDAMRIISLRKANAREGRIYEANQTQT